MNGSCGGVVITEKLKVCKKNTEKRKINFVHGVTTTTVIPGTTTTPILVFNQMYNMERAFDASSVGDIVDVSVISARALSFSSFSTISSFSSFKNCRVFVCVLYM